jgi:hypothetical protein
MSKINNTARPRPQLQTYAQRADDKTALRPVTPETARPRYAYNLRPRPQLQSYAQRADEKKTPRPQLQTYATRKAV